MAVYSMTGFAGVDGVTASGVGFTLSLKGVNHRFLDLSLRLPPGCEGLEIGLRREMKAAVRRGHVDVTVVAHRREASAAQLQLNEALLGAYMDAFHHAAKMYGVAAEPDLNGMLRQPGVLRMESAPAPEDGAALEAAVLAALPEALWRFNEARAREGAALAAELCAAMRRLERLTAEVAEFRLGVRELEVERLRGRLGELMQGGVSGERILAEAALLVERSDVDEELVRLQAHAAQFMALVEGGGELGKRLDFLLQELAREANTLLSKTGGAAAGHGLRVTELGLEMKLEIERAREQVQNLE